MLRNPLHHSSLRTRTIVGPIAIVGVSLIVASLALVGVMRHVMTGNARDAARLRAHDIVEGLQGGQSPSSLVQGNDDDVLVQIIDSNGKIVAASTSLTGDPPLARLGSGGATTVGHPPVGDDDPFEVVAERTEIQAGTFLVLVGRNLDIVRETLATTSLSLFIGIPILLALVGFVTWRVVGRSLAPVESMRRDVAQISETDLNRRLSEPEGNDEIARLGRTMNDMLSRLERGREEQLRLVADASHELRNPIATIRQYVEVALAHPETTSLEELARDVLSEDLRLHRLSNDLLLLARFDEGGLQMENRSCDVDDLVLEEAERLKRSTDLRINIDDVKPARVHGDAGKLRRVVANLSDNAARHASTTVKFVLQTSDGEVRLEVEDDGPGVPVASRDHIFDRFARLDDARDREHGGAGLGLAIVAAVAKAHGGTAAAIDGSLGGARFIVRLPAEA